MDDPPEARDFFLLQIVQTSYGAHPASYTVGTTGDVVTVCSWLPTST